MNMTIDWDNVDENAGGGDFVVAEMGWHLVVVDEIEQKQSKSTGAEMWRITYRVVDGQYKGSKIWDTLPFSPKGMSRCKIALSAMLGRPLPKMSADYQNGQTLHMNYADMFMNSTLWIEVDGHETNDAGKRYPNVSYDGFRPLKKDEVAAGTTPTPQAQTAQPQPQQQPQPQSGVSQALAGLFPPEESEANLPF